MNAIRNSRQSYHKLSFEGFSINEIFSRGYSVHRNAKKSTTKNALNHYDNFYKAIYKNKWPSIRLALVSMQKNVALINNFGDTEEAEETLRLQGAFNLAKFLEYSSEEDNAQNEEIVQIESEKIGSFIKEEMEKDKAKVLGSLHSNESERSITNIFQTSSTEIDDNDDTSSDDESHDSKQREALYDILNKSPTPLHSARGQSDYDYSRLIDPSLGLDGSSLHEYIPATKLKGLDDFILEGDYYSHYNLKPEIAINVEEENELKFPETLKIFTFGRGDVSAFPNPEKSVNDVFNYYVVEGSSLLPVLALGLELGDQVLDMCSAPGNKGFIIFQTLLPDCLVCNDVLISRLNLVHNLFKHHLFDYDASSDWKNKLRVTESNGQNIDNAGYDKILVDVPSTEDKLSALQEENNIFHPSRVKYRLRLPQLQSTILANALKIVKKGGTVVYSTSSLSPIQNDGVVKMALQTVWSEYRMEFTVKDLTPALRKFSPFFKFASDTGMQYGSLVLPFLPLNFGPTYFCKLVKNN